jgi:hypothetical protein
MDKQNFVNFQQTRSHSPSFGSSDPNICLEAQFTSFKFANPNLSLEVCPVAQKIAHKLNQVNQNGYSVNQKSPKRQDSKPSDPRSSKSNLVGATFKTPSVQKSHLEGTKMNESSRESSKNSKKALKPENVFLEPIQNLDETSKPQCPRYKDYKYTKQSDLPVKPKEPKLSVSEVSDNR